LSFRDDLPALTSDAFRSLQIKGALAKLDEAERMVLFVLLKCYENCRTDGSDFAEMEKIAKIAAEAAALSPKLKEIFDGRYSDILPLYTSRYRKLPMELAAFAATSTKPFLVCWKAWP
jgi:hypothetical protein